jgi:tetratricopeptide (TPR) repeat protein
MKYKLALGARVKSISLFLAVAPLVLAAGADLDRARKLYNSTDFDASLGVLQAIPRKDGPVYELMGRDYFMQGEYKNASEALEKAVAAVPSSSEYALWLGRAYGRRAETSSPFTAPGLASKARQFFEKAVQLNPRNMEALNDLFEYYLEAPGFLGGGFDRAANMASRIGELDAAEGHYAQAKLAEKRKEYSKAEEHLNRAVESAPQQIGRLIDLAKFLATQGRYQEAERSFAKAETIAPNNPKLMYERAEVYIKTGRNIDLAKELLKRYLIAPLTPDDPPRSDAQKLLRQVRGS